MSRFFGVYLTARSATFIRGETEVMVPLTMVPFLSSTVTVSFWHFMRNLAQWLAADLRVGFVFAHLTSFMIAVF